MSLHDPWPQAVVGFRDQHGQYKQEDRIPAWAKRVVEHFHDGQRTFDGSPFCVAGFRTALPLADLTAFPPILGGHFFLLVVGSRLLGSSSALPVEELQTTQANCSPHL